jgi:hypothetical protein
MLASREFRNLQTIDDLCTTVETAFEESRGKRIIYGKDELSAETAASARIRLVVDNAKLVYLGFFYVYVSGAVVECCTYRVCSKFNVDAADRRQLLYNSDGDLVVRYDLPFYAAEVRKY